MLIVHRCRKCGHPDYWGRTEARSVVPGGTINGKAVTAQTKQRTKCDGVGGCTCRDRCDYGPPETARRWSSTTMQPVTEVAPPGTSPNGNGGFTCSCDACTVLYRRITATTDCPLAATAPG